MIGPYEENSIVLGDARELTKAIPDESIELVFTDPPYKREFLPLYGWLAEESARILKPSCMCIALCGHYALPQITQMMGRHLDFYWIGGMLHSLNMAAKMFSKNIMCAWKPVLWYGKGRPRPHRWLFDAFMSPRRDKQWHKWGQSTAFFQYYIDKLSEPNELVFDPFLGGGTTAVVCRILGRKFLGFEIDSQAYEIAQRRSREARPPLMVFDRQGSLI